VPSAAKEYLTQIDQIVNECGGPIESPLLTIDPVVRHQFEQSQVRILPGVFLFRLWPPLFSPGREPVSSKLTWLIDEQRHGVFGCNRRNSFATIPSIPA
jgi:hypothetical protein